MSAMQVFSDKGIMTCLVQYLSTRDVFCLFGVCAALRRKWRVHKTRPYPKRWTFEQKCEEVKQARGWRAVFQLDRRLDAQFGIQCDSSVEDPMAVYRKAISGGCVPRRLKRVRLSDLSAEELKRIKVFGPSRRGWIWL